MDNLGKMAIKFGLIDSPTAFAHRDKIEGALRSIADDGKSDAGIGQDGFDFWIKIQGIDYYIHAAAKQIKQE